MGKLSKAAGERSGDIDRAAIWDRDLGHFAVFEDDYKTAMAKEAAVQRAAEEHKQTRHGHEITTERDIRCHFPVRRDACSCGWRGEWSRIHSGN